LSRIAFLEARCITQAVKINNNRASVESLWT